MAKTPGPVAWPEVVAKLGATYEQGLSFFDNLGERITSGARAAGALGGYSITVSALAALRGRNAATKALALVTPHLPRVVAELEEPLTRDNLIPSISALSVLNAVRCCDGELSDDVDDV